MTGHRWAQCFDPTSPGLVLECRRCRRRREIDVSAPLMSMSGIVDREGRRGSELGSGLSPTRLRR